ncbi:LPXTG cell wall anchor domain-containing protein [Flagellimonas marinaquae]|uniref:LPXTG cell wall anchor domain-containing protein n=1 Tax=Flagellimonas marinaquae TaxID=254955 RepID=UPI000F8C3D94|nr:LPXTG cell wall anchor domain-containing protein [Allomuricauda aquimarina]
MSLILGLLSAINLLIAEPELPKDSYVAFVSNGDYHILGKDSLYTSSDGTYWNSRKHRFRINPHELVALNKGDTTYLVGRGGGTVHRFVNDTVERIDRSFPWRSRYYSHLFVRKDQIMSFAGTGLFAEKNNFIYYDERKREWFEYYAMNPEEIPHVADPVGTYDDDDDNYTFTLGRAQRYKGEVFYQQNSNIYVFDFKDRTWKNIGKLPEEVFIPLYRKVMEYDKPLVHTNNTLLEFRFDEQRILQYDHGPILPILENAQSILYNQAKGSFLVLASYGFNVRPKVIAETDLVGGAYTEIPLQMNDTFPWAYSLIGLLSIGLGIYFYARRKRNRTIVFKDILGHLEDTLPSEDLKVLQSIVEKHPQPITYPELLEDYDGSLSYESRVKKLRESLKNINQKAMEFNGGNKLLREGKSQNDKRIKQIGIDL